MQEVTIANAKGWLKALRRACEAAPGEFTSGAVVFCFQRTLGAIARVAAADPGTHCFDLEPDTDRMYASLSEVADLPATSTLFLIIGSLEQYDPAPGRVAGTAELIRNDGLGNLEQIIAAFEDQ